MSSERRKLVQFTDEIVTIKKIAVFRFIISCHCFRYLEYLSLLDGDASSIYFTNVMDIIQFCLHHCLSLLRQKVT